VPALVCWDIDTDEGAGMAGSNANANAGAGSAIYGLGVLGAVVYFWQQADAFWEYVLAVVQGLVWPAIMVYEGFAALAA
jgi:hypothetical protein